jgi:thiol:disulfide interchange protein DsbC
MLLRVVQARNKTGRIEFGSNDVDEVIMRNLRWVLLLVCLGGLPASVAAGEVPDAVGNAVKHLFDNKAPDKIEPSPMPGFFQVTFGAQLYYVSRDGRYLVAGSIYEVASKRNLTEEGQNGGRAKLISALDEAGMVVFKAAEELSQVTVFTDVSCGYCIKFHQEMADLNAGGVTVRYVGFPRAGINSEAYDALVSVWCADDRRSAMTDAKAGRQIAPLSCDTPIARHKQLGEEIGVRGTPTIVLENGRIIGGYVPAEELIQQAREAAATRG